MPRDDKSTGEITVRAPWLTQGYLKNHKSSERLWEGRYLHTGDVAVRDERGFVRITDRMKDVIKVGGEWISSLELEDMLGHHPAVNEAAVIGQLDDKWGERPLALVVLKPESRGTVRCLAAVQDAGPVIAMNALAPSGSRLLRARPAVRAELDALVEKIDILRLRALLFRGGQNCSMPFFVHDRCR